MTSKRDSVNRAPGAQRAVKRMRLARRVADVLLPQPDGVILEALAPTEVLSGNRESPRSPVGDFTLTVLDLKVRLVLLVGQTSEALNEAGSITLASDILRDHPDTIACALIADDEALTTRLIETGGADEIIASDAGISDTVVGPIRSVLEQYLRLIDPSWPTTPTVLIQGQLDYQEVATRAAHDAVEDRRLAPGRVTERQAARASLSDRDADWAVGVSLRVAAGDELNLLELVEQTPGGAR